MANGADEYVSVPAACNMVVGKSGNVGDYIERVTAVVLNATTSGITLTDGTNNAVQLLPNAVGAGIGTYQLPLGISSTSGAWRLVTNNGVSAIVSGVFSK